jgi:hypothetical protein
MQGCKNNRVTRERNGQLRSLPELLHPRKAGRAPRSSPVPALLWVARHRSAGAISAQAAAIAANNYQPINAARAP